MGSQGVRPEKEKVVSGRKFVGGEKKRVSSCTRKEKMDECLT